MRRGALDRRVQFRRYTETVDDFGTVMEWEDHGHPNYAKKKDVSDGERFRAQEVEATITTRFTVRFNEFTMDITPRDRIVCEGITYNISGIKEVGERRRWLEITAAGRADLLGDGP